MKSQIVIIIQLKRVIKFNNTIGSIVIGNYTLEKSIGEGTFGKVHLGFHILTKEKVKN